MLIYPAYIPYHIEIGPKWLGGRNDPPWKLAETTQGRNDPEPFMGVKII